MWAIRATIVVNNRRLSLAISTSAIISGTSISTPTTWPGQHRNRGKASDGHHQLSENKAIVHAVHIDSAEPHNRFFAFQKTPLVRFLPQASRVQRSGIGVKYALYLNPRDFAPWRMKPPECAIPSLMVMV